MSIGKQLPAVEWLGFGLDMTFLTPFDITSVKGLIKKQTRIIEVNKDPKTHDVTIDGIVYKVPRSVFASEDTGNVQSSFVTYKSGAEALRNFQTDSGVAERYLAVSADPSSFPLGKSLPDGYQFAFYNYNANLYTAGVQDYLDFVNEKALLRRISELPMPFKDDAGVIAAYTKFFREVGSHVITNVNYGARCHLDAWASNAYDDVNSNWSRDLTASVEGLTSGGKYDPKVFDEPQYQIFDSLVQRLLTVHGGDESLAAALMQGPATFDAFKTWSGTIKGNPAFVSMKVTELWSLLKDTSNKTLRNSADSIRDAFNAIAAPKQPRQTSTLVIFEIESGQAELGILTPSAIIGVGGPQPAFDPTAQKIVGLSQTKVRWSNEDSEKDAAKTKVIIPIYVVNDGTPLDLYITRGSGKAQATIDTNVYVNDQTDEHTKWFYQVPVTTVTVEGNHTTVRVD